MGRRTKVWNHEKTVIDTESSVIKILDGGQVVLNIIPISK